MISVQSIAVAVAATGMTRDDESRLFRFTIKHSILLMVVMAIISMCYAYVFPACGTQRADSNRSAVLARAWGLSPSSDPCSPVRQTSHRRFKFLVSAQTLITSGLSKPLTSSLAAS